MAKKFCPKCKSENIKWQDGGLYGTPGNWVCEECGFYNQEFPIKEEEINKNGKEK